MGLDPVVVRIVGRCGVFRGQSLARQFTNAMARLKLLNLIWRSSDDPSSGSCLRLSSSANNALSSSSARTTFSGTDSTKSASASAETAVPVGLFGLATKISRVFAVIAARVASAIVGPVVYAARQVYILEVSP